MTPTFRKLTLEQFAELFMGYQFTRRINGVHMHHTFKPNHATWRGHETVVGMWRHHTVTNGWSDIAQHITIDPEGLIWTGRNWNKAPASASGHNGSAAVGPFMFELVGDFDIGRDRFEGAQRETALEVITLVQTRFNLTPESLRFHRDMSHKTCPGSSIQYEEILAELRTRLASPDRVGKRTMVVIGEPVPFGSDALAIETLRRELVVAGADAARDPVDAEPEEEDVLVRVPAVSATKPEFTDRRPTLNPENLAALRPYVINLRQGEFSNDGLFATAAGDVDSIFEEHLPREIEVARAKGVPPRIMFYAHGGLVSETAALLKAHERIEWWLRQGIYPIYFVWETGLFEVVGQLLERIRSRVLTGTRDVWDYTTDPIVESAVRALRGPTIWSGMKRSAERSCIGTGGALHTALRVASFCAKHPDVELHAVGHSAGAIFLSHFMPSALNAGARTFKTVHFLAPAVRTDVFRERLGDLLGSGIDALTIYTMRKDLERADHCKSIYRKSLLYLVSNALEPESQVPLLGLEESLRNDVELRRIFGLGEKPSPVANVVWSPSTLETGRNASRATTHGAFDDDAATLDSIARRILDLTDADGLSAPALTPLMRSYGWEDGVDWPERLQTVVDRPVVEPIIVQHPTITPKPGGRRRALLVGIDHYMNAPLSGAVADARLWSRALGDLGFEAEQLLNERATRSAILDRLGHLVNTSAPGDVVVFQFAGHGTQLEDLDGDDTDDMMDEALCPYDMASGAFIIDDDLGRIFDNVRPGVNLTCFIDCCHSGTISRLGIGRTELRTDQRVRFIRATPAMQQAHFDFRSRIGVTQGVPRGRELMKEVLFAACEPFEVALESNGQGEYTQRAVQVLTRHGHDLTNEQFHAHVINAFGATPRQHPRLDCPPSARTLGLLQPFAAESVTTVPSVSAIPKEMLTEALRLISLAVHA